MSDVTIKRYDEFDSYESQGQFVFAGKGLGVKAWGMNLINLPPNYAEYPDHDHVEDGQEEVYVVLKGDARLVAGKESWNLAPGTMARVGPAVKRKIVPGASGATVLALGGTPGKAYELPAWIK